LKQLRGIRDTALSLSFLRSYVARRRRWQFGALQMADPGDNGTAPSVLGNILGA
jgi:hypothetical protein